MLQEIPHTNSGIGPETLADVKVGREDALKQIAGALACHTQRKQEQVDKIYKFIGDAIDFKNRGTPGDMSEIEADF